MATFLAAQPQQPLPGFAPKSPPDHAPFYANGDLHQISSTNNTLSDKEESRANFISSSDFPSSPATMAVNGNGAMPVPKRGPHNMPYGIGRHRSTLSMGAFEGPRSPPNAKNTAHVPCKFFRLGQCQAGKACPFSHALDISGDEVCKYFQKGNCKFGAKCALAHILPNGRRVNRPNGPSRGSMDFGGRIDPQLYRQSDPALAHSLLAQQANGGPSAFTQQLPPFVDNDHSLPQTQPGDNIPVIDTEFASPQYGSPKEGSGTAFAPSGHLSARDAPMPASFDSQGISHIARYGPLALSAPTRFGPEVSSPPSSAPQRALAPSESTNAIPFSLASRQTSRPKAPDLGSSPLTSGDEGPPHRHMHSQRIVKSRMSASLPKFGLPLDDWDEGFHFSEGEETDYIPPSLHDQILTPQEKMRRLSRNDQDNRSIRESLSGVGTPGESSSKVGSPNAGSPSRYGAFFARRQQDNSNISGSPSNFGPVGSPLRNLHPGASPSMRATNISDDVTPSFPAFASPPHQSSMSILSQQLRRTRLSSRHTEASEGPNGSLHPSSARHSSAPSSAYNRTVSSSTNKGRIEEEGGEGVFSMEEEEQVRSRRQSGTNVLAWGAVGSGRAPDWI